MNDLSSLNQPSLSGTEVYTENCMWIDGQSSDQSRVYGKPTMPEQPGLAGTALFLRLVTCKH